MAFNTGKLSAEAATTSAVVQGEGDLSPVAVVGWTQFLYKILEKQPTYHPNFFHQLEREYRYRLL
jgi:hypothetical protein